MRILPITSETRRAFDFAHLSAVLLAADRRDLAGVWCNAARGHQTDPAARFAYRALDHRIHGGGVLAGSLLGLDGLSRCGF